MKILTSISKFITGLLLLSTLICGLWMSSVTNVSAGNMRFHMTCGVAAVCFFFITVLGTWLVKRKGE